MKALTATLERLGISLNKNSQMTQASNLLTVVSTKTLYLMLFVRLENWRTGDKLVPTSAGVQWRAPRNPLDLGAYSSHISMQKVLLFFFSLPPFLLLSSPLY